MNKVPFLFGQLDDGDVRWLAGAGTLRALGEGEVLIEQDASLEVVFVVLEGTFAVVRRGAGWVATIGKGEVLGEMSFVDSRPPSATVTALSHAVVLAVPRARLVGRLEAEPPFAARFYRAVALFLSDRLRAAEPPDDAGMAGELDPMVLDQVTAAGLRFERMAHALLHADGALP